MKKHFINDAVGFYMRISPPLNTRKATVGIEGMDYAGWQITDTYGHIVKIVSTKRRQKIIEYIRQKASMFEI